MCMHLPLIPWSIAGVPSSRALPGYPNTALAPECIPVVIGALPVWIQTQQKQNKKCKERKERQSVSCCGNLSAFEPGASGLPHYYTQIVCVPDVIGALGVWRQNTQQKKISAQH